MANLNNMTDIDKLTLIVERLFRRVQAVEQAVVDLSRRSTFVPKSKPTKRRPRRSTHDWDKFVKDVHQLVENGMLGTAIAETLKVPYAHVVRARAAYRKWEKQK